MAVHLVIIAAAAWKPATWPALTQAVAQPLALSMDRSGYTDVVLQWARACHTRGDARAGVQV